MGYLINDTGYNQDTIRIGIDDEAKRILEDGGSVEGYQSAANDINDVVTKDVYDNADVAMYPVSFKAERMDSLMFQLVCFRCKRYLDK